MRRNQTRVHDDAGSSAERPDSDQRSTSHQHAKHHHRSVLLWRRCDMGRVLPVPWTTCALGVQFGSVLQPSSIRRLATPWTYFLHLSLSSVILIDSSTESPVHVLMLSIQAVCGLPRLRAPDIDIPCIISLSPGNSLVSSWCDDNISPRSSVCGGIQTFHSYSYRLHVRPGFGDSKQRILKLTRQGAAWI